jgi:hypothetical protein
MKRSWIFNWDPHRVPAFVGRSKDGAEVVFQSAEGLISFLESGSMNSKSVGDVLRDLYSARTGCQARVDIDDDWK